MAVDVFFHVSEGLLHGIPQGGHLGQQRLGLLVDPPLGTFLQALTDNR